MKLVPNQPNPGKLLVGDLDAFGVGSLVQFGLNSQSSACSRTDNQLDQDFMADEGASSPVHADIAKQTMLDLVPFARSRWEMSDRNRESRLVGQLLQFKLPGPYARSVASAAVGGDQERGRPGIGGFSHHLPPSPDTLDGKGGRVMIRADIDPSGIHSQIVHPVRARARSPDPRSHEPGRLPAGPRVSSPVRCF